MKNIYIIICLLIILFIIILTQKKEHIVPTSQMLKTLSGEAIQNIAKVYSDTSGTAVFNNLVTTGNIGVKGDIGVKGGVKVNGDIKSNTNMEINGNIKGYSNMEINKNIKGNNLEINNNIIGGGNMDISGNMKIDKEIKGNSYMEIVGDIRGNSNMEISGDIKGNSNFEISGNMIGNGVTKLMENTRLNKIDNRKPVILTIQLGSSKVAIVDLSGNTFPSDKWLCRIINVNSNVSYSPFLHRTGVVIGIRNNKWWISSFSGWNEWQHITLEFTPIHVRVEDYYDLKSGFHPAITLDTVIGSGMNSKVIDGWATGPVNNGYSVYNSESKQFVSVTPPLT